MTYKDPVERGIDSLEAATWGCLIGMVIEFFKWVWRELFPPQQPCHPQVPNLRDWPYEYIYPESETLGTVWMGKPGSGKTTSCANHRVDYDIAHPNDCSFALDKSGDYTNDYLAIFSKRPEWEKFKDKIKVIVLGDPRYVTPFPELSPLHGTTYDEQVSRVTENFKRLLNHAEDKAVIVAGGALNSILPHVLRLCVAMANVRPTHEPFQLTEVPILLDNPTYLQAALNKVGNSLNLESRLFLQRRLLDVKERENEFRTYALGGVFTALGMDAGKAHLGADRPIFTIRDAIENGWKVLIDGHKLLNRPALLDHFMTQFYAMILDEIMLRVPHDPSYNNVAILLDEIKKFFKTPQMSEELSENLTFLRSRKTQFHLLLQSPKGQLDDNMQVNIWNIGNKVVFGMRNKQDCETAAYQMGIYDPVKEKQPARTQTQNPITEPEQGQDRTVADWIWTFQPRECLMQVDKSESESISYIFHVKKTRQAVMERDFTKLLRLKEEMFHRTAIPSAEAIASIERRLGELQVAGNIVNTDNKAGKTANAPKPINSPVTGDTVPTKVKKA